MEQTSWKILLVEDDEDDFLLTRDMLQDVKRGKNTLEWIRDYKTGLTALLTGDYDAALVDYDLGLHNGLNLIRQAVAGGCKLPLVLFTGRGSHDVDMEAIQAGATLYLTKGETSSLLLERGIRYAIERKQGELALQNAIAALKESEERFHSLFTEMSEGFALHEIILDKHGCPCDYRFLEINPSFERLTGLKRQDIIGKLVTQVLPDDDPNWIQIYGQVALTGKPVHFEKYSSALKQFYDVVSYRPAPLQFAVIFMNTTERRQMEESIRVNLAKYSTLFDLFPQGITVADKDGNILETNQEAERLLGVPKDEHQHRQIGSPTWKIIRPDGSPMPTEEWPSVRALSEGRQVSNVEMGIVKSQDDVTWINVSATPIPVEGYGVVVTYGDVTERKHLEDAAREREARLRLLSKASNEGIAVSEDGVIIQANQRFAEMHGYEPAEVIGMRIMDFLVPEDRERAIKLMMENAEVISCYTAVRKDNTRFRIEAHGCALDIFERHLRIGNIRDITLE